MPKKPSSSSSPSSSSVVSAPRRHKRKKAAHHQKPPFMLRLLLFLSRAGVNINRPPPLKKLLAGIVGCLFLVVVALVRPSLRASTRLNGEKNAVRCARTFPDVASHQLLTNDPTTKSGGFEAMDYLRDRYGVTNYDIGTPFALPFMVALSFTRGRDVVVRNECVVRFFSSFLSFDRLLFADDIDARDDADREDTRTTTTTTDAVRLKDGTLLATHPQRLFDWIQKEAKDVTLEEARALGANERSFATMEDLIAHFAKMTGTRGAKKGARRALRETLLLAHELGKNIGGMGSSSKRIGIDGTFFGVDLKGDALNAENVVLVNEFAKKANVVDAVSYYVTDPESEASKNIQKALERSFPKSEDRIKMTWALRDVDGSHWNTEKLARENLERMNIRGLLPSAKFDEKWYSKAVKESNAWVESWVADDLETALELRKKGVHAMISNVPEAVIEGIKQFCMNGESRELAVKALVKMRGM